MLSAIAEGFNFLASIIYYGYAVCCLVGKVIFYVAFEIGAILYKIISKILICLNMFTDEFKYFFKDFSLEASKICSFVTNCLAATASQINSLVHEIAQDILRINRTIILKVEYTGNFLFTMANAMYQTIIGALFLIGNLMYTVLMLIPNLIMYIAIFVKHCFIYILDIIRILSKVIVENVRNMPIQVALGVITVAIIILNQQFVMECFELFTKIIVKCIIVGIANLIYLHLIAIRYIKSKINIFFDRLTKIRLRSNLIKEEEFYNGFDEILCIICQERRKCVVLFPCKHLCMCEECCENLSTENCCPLCRKSIKQKISVYL